MKKIYVLPILIVLGVSLFFAINMLPCNDPFGCFSTEDQTGGPGVGTIVYVKPRLPYLMNDGMEILNLRQYVPWEPVLILEDRGRNIIKVRFCSDGYEQTYSRLWFSTYRLSLKAAPLTYCESRYKPPITMHAQ